MEVTMNKMRNLIISSLLVVLVLPTSFAFAAGSEDFRGVNYAHCAEKEFVQSKNGGFSGDDLYDSAADLTGEEINFSINFPCEEAVADQLSSGTFSSEDADVMAYRLARFYEKNTQLNNQMNPDDVVAYDWPQFYGNGPLENLKDPGDMVAYRWARIYGNGLLENLKDPGDVGAYDWARYFGYGPLENLNDPDDVVTYDWPQFYGNRLLNTK
jgi:hypothetical protein